MSSRLMLLDSAGLYFRAFFGMPERGDTAAVPTNAIRGLLDMTASLVTRYSPDELVACWDTDWRPAFRYEAIPTYKAHRVADEATNTEEVAPELVAQVPVIADLLDAMGIFRFGAPECEADDVIGTLTARALGPVDIVTGDRDLFQLVDDAGAVRVIYVARGGVRDPDHVDEAWLDAKYGLPSGDAYADFAVLRGDPSDGLPGVSGVGEKSAAALLSAYGTLDAIVAAVEGGDPGIKGAQRTRLQSALSYLQVAPSVVRVRLDADVPDGPYPLPKAWANAATVEEMTMRFGLESPVSRIAKALGIVR